MMDEMGGGGGGGIRQSGKDLQQISMNFDVDNLNLKNQQQNNYRTAYMVKKLKRTRTANDKKKHNNTEKKNGVGQKMNESFEKPIDEKEEKDADEDAFDGFSYKMMSDHDFNNNQQVSSNNFKSPDAMRSN